MSLILPYKEEIATSEGCYITQEGEFILTHGSHTGYTVNNFNNHENHFDEYLDQFKGYTNMNVMPRFPVQVKNWDRLRTIGTRAIESTYQVPNQRFFNWLLMEWPIIQLEALIYNTNTGNFEYEEFNLEQYQANKELNEEYGNEIKRLKLEIPIKHRYQHFK